MISTKTSMYIYNILEIINSISLFLNYIGNEPPLRETTKQLKIPAFSAGAGFEPKTSCLVYTWAFDIYRNF